MLSRRWLPHCPGNGVLPPIHLIQCQTGDLSVVQELLWKIKLGCSKFKLSKKKKKYKYSIIWHINKVPFLFLYLNSKTNTYFLTMNIWRCILRDHVLWYKISSWFWTRRFRNLRKARKDTLGSAQHRHVKGTYSRALWNWFFCAYDENDTSYRFWCRQRQ